MKYPLISAIIATAIIASAAFASAQEKVGDIVKAGDTAYMLVCELKTPEQNVNFQRNINIMQRDSQAIDFFRKKIGEESDPAKKAELERKLKILEKNFETNDAAMRKAYGFSANRKYRMIFLESNICVPLSNDALSSLKDEAGNALDPMKIFQRGNKSLYLKKTVTGDKDNEALQRTIGFIVKRRADVEKLRKELAETTDPSKQMEITSKLGSGEKALVEAEEKMRVQYGIKSKSDYVIETSKSKLYLVLTPEEILKIEAQKKLDAK